MAEQEQQEKQIAIQKIYLKDFSFESPHAPMVFTKNDWEPKTNLNLRSTHAEVEIGFRLEIFLSTSCRLMPRSLEMPSPHPSLPSATRA